jgi:hypothetical protein
MSNILRALHALRLPDEIAPINGVITSRTFGRIVNKRTHDFTTGRRVIKDEYYVERVTDERFRTYAFNFLRGRADGCSFENGRFVRDVIPATDDRTWFSRVDIGFNDAWDKIIIEQSVGFNTFNGVNQPYINPLVTVEREEWIVTKTSTTPPRMRNGQYVRSYPRLTLSEILIAMKLTREELEYQLREEFSVAKPSESTHILNYGCEVFKLPSALSDSFDIIVYANGESMEADRPSGKITSYQKQWPGVVKFIRLHNGEVNESVYGSTDYERILLSASDFFRIEFYDGDVTDRQEIDYDGKEFVVKVNRNEPAYLHVGFKEGSTLMEEQGKGDGAEAIYMILEGENERAELVRVY